MRMLTLHDRAVVKQRPPIRALVGADEDEAGRLTAGSCDSTKDGIPMFCTCYSSTLTPLLVTLLFACADPDSSRWRACTTPRRHDRCA